jgi:hypothetical protein
VFTELIELLPLAGVFLVFAIVSLVLYETGFRVGRWQPGTYIGRIVSLRRRSSQR